jgi:tetratricopeptide (TPR) repeat protein
MEGVKTEDITLEGVDEAQKSGLTPEEKAKKDKQRPKVDKFMSKVDAKKEKAAELFKLGQYGEAVNFYKQATEMLESAIDDFPLFKQELNMVEATIFNNIAACCKKELNSKMEIEYTTKVIDKQEYLTDKNVLLKAYLRRGLAYEQLEKYGQAKEDMLSVKQLQYDNKQASQCLNRCNKAIKDIYGDSPPSVKPNAPIKLCTDSSLLSEKKSSPVKNIVTPSVNISELKTKL